MYSFKEKKKHLKELSNLEAAHADLLLLKQVQPTLPSLRSFERNPQRYAQDILYSLLDFRSREDIRNHRREFMHKENPEATPVPTTGLQPDDETDDNDKAQDDDHSGEDKVETAQGQEQSTTSNAEVDQPKAQPEESVECADQTEIKNEPLQQEQATTSSAEVEQLKEQLQEAEERADQVEEENASLQEELESEQEAREQAEASLEEEKKKEPEQPKVQQVPNAPAKSRSTRSTRK